MATRNMTNRSGTLAAGATAQTAMAANTGRQYLLVENPSTALGQGIAAAESLWINFTTTAVVGQPSIELVPGGSYERELPGYMTPELVSVIATTVGHAYVAKEA